MTQHPPTGTVTFLFTDIEGSTRLWEQDPDAMREALARHDALLREAIEAHAGYVFKTVGDAFCAAFARAPDALAAALALQVAAELLDAFPHGVFFVPLVAVQSPDGVLPAIAQALDIQATSSQGHFGAGQSADALKDRVHDYVRRKHMLLVLDNFEQVVAAGPLVTELLATAPDLKVLVTSRALLRVYGEREYPVPPLLALPDSVHPPDAELLTQYAAVLLFIERARAVAPGFAVDNANAPAVAELCYRLGGSPLAIELAAAWSDMLAPEEILEELSESLDILETDLGDVPDRQRSMRAVFDYSWHLLSEKEQTVFAALSVFRGGFTREAAKAVAEASLRDLRGLLNKSLVQRVESGRYEVHELLRQYAEEQLARTPEAAEAARDAHSAYYCTALERLWAAYKSAKQRAAIQALMTELENARAAWDWAVTHRHVARLDQAVAGLCTAYEVYGERVTEAETACRAAAQSLEILAEQTLSLAQGRFSSLPLGVCNFVLGCVALAEQVYSQAYDYLCESTSILKDRSEWEYIWALVALAITAHGAGRAPQAWRHLGAALRHITQTGNFGHHLYTLSAAALLLSGQGDVERAVEIYALASRYPFVANSLWFADVVGQPIAEVAVPLPPNVVAAAQARGRDRDLLATVKELLAAFEKNETEVL